MLATAMAASAQNGVVIEGADFLAGFVFGMTAENHLTEIERCMTGGELILSEVEKGIADIKAGGWENDAKAALEFGLVVTQVPQALSMCENMDDDLQAIKDWGQIFLNPAELAATVTKHYIFNKREIKSDIGALESDWNNGLFFKAGVDLADLMTLAVGPIEEVAELFKISEMAGGKPVHY